jgi:protein-disulfide isomerase
LTKEEAGKTIRLALEVSERDHIKGPRAAPVTLVEYGDYGCPYCAQAYLILREVQERLGPKLRFVFRNFPITKLRPISYKVALAAEGAAAQNMFWEMYDNLFKHGQTNAEENLKQSAASLGLDMVRFDQEFLESTYSSHLDEDIESGKSSGVTKTPTFFINGDRYDGSWDLDSLLGALDEASVFSWKEDGNPV